MDKAGGIRLTHGFETLADTGEDARQDHAGIPPRTQQHLMGGAARCLAEQRTFRRFGGARLDGHKHIVAGIPVGNRKNIQIIDCRAVHAEILRAAAQHIQIHQSVNGFCHIAYPKSIR